MQQTKKSEQNGSISEHRITVKSPIGLLVIAESDGAICSIGLDDAREVMLSRAEESVPVLTKAARELEEYFAGTRETFTFPMRAQGTPFQKSVWAALLEIPFGETKTYGEIAKRIDNPKGSRAVGMACNKNPIMIAVPCHRVVGAGGALTGYAYGIETKRTLLNLEQRV